MEDLYVHSIINEFHLVISKENTEGGHKTAMFH